MSTLTANLPEVKRNGRGQSISRLPVTIKTAGATDIGKIRSVNQDSFAIVDSSSPPSQYRQPVNSSVVTNSGSAKLLIVADGVGGAQAGEIASQLAVDTIAQQVLLLLNSIGDETNWDQIEIRLESAILLAHCKIRQICANNPKIHHMGTTLTVACIAWPHMVVAHVGDSRCYHWNNGTLEQVTEDQTLAQYLFDTQVIDQAGLAKSPYHHVLTSSLGGAETPNVRLYKRELNLGDRVLLCSDGITGQLDDDMVELILSCDSNPRFITSELIAHANAKGGHDNITAVVAFA